MVDTDRPDLIRRATSPYRCTDAIVPTVLKVRKNMGHRSYRILHIITSGSDLRVDGHGGSDATRRIGTGTPDTTPVPWSRGRVFGRAIFPAICVFNAIRRRSTISSRNGERESIRSQRRRPTCHESGSIHRPRGADGVSFDHCHQFCTTYTTTVIVRFVMEHLHGVSEHQLTALLVTEVPVSERSSEHGRDVLRTVERLFRQCSRS